MSIPRAVVALVMLASAVVLAPRPASAGDRHAGYYYPEPATHEVYEARATTLPEANREVRLGFVVGVTQTLLRQPYAPAFVIFAKGDEAEKMIIVGLAEGYMNTLYRARAVLAMLTAVARSTRFLNERGVAEYLTFFDLAKLLGFTRITISDGRTFAHQITIR